MPREGATTAMPRIVLSTTAAARCSGLNHPVAVTLTSSRTGQCRNRGCSSAGPMCTVYPGHTAQLVVNPLQLGCGSGHPNEGTATTCQPELCRVESQQNGNCG